MRPTISGRRRWSIAARQWHVRHERDVGGLIAAIGKIDAGRGLRCAAHPEQNDVRMVEIFRRLTVIAHHAEIERVDPLEIIGVEHVLRAGARRGVLSEVGFEQRQDWSQDRQARRARCFAAFFKPLRKIGIDQRKENDSGRVLDLGNHPIELGRGAHQRIDMFDRGDALILRRGGARGGDQRLAGRVRDQMKMEIAAAQCGPHGRKSRAVITGRASCGQAWKAGLADAERRRSRDEARRSTDSQPSSAGQIRCRSGSRR